MDARELDEKIEDLRKKLDDVYVKEIKASNPQQLQEKVVQLSKQVEDVDVEKENDSALRELKAKVSAKNGGYRDTKKFYALKRQYLLLVMQERGLIK